MVSAGFLYPGHAAEDDYPYLSELLDAGLSVVHTTIGEDLHTVEALRETGKASRLADGVRRLRRQSSPWPAPGVQSVMWACTSGSFVFGWDGAAQQVLLLAEDAGVPASSTSFAFVHALRHLEITRVGISATYPSDLASHFTSFLRDGGLEVVRRSSHDIVTAAGAGTLTKDGVLALAAAGDHPSAQAVLLPDTALHTARWLDDLEEHLGKPVLTANQVTVWEGLRLAGDTVPRTGAGTLFSGGGLLGEGGGKTLRNGDHEHHIGTHLPPVDR